MTVENTSLFDPSKKQLTCRGEWDIANLKRLQTLLNHTVWPTAGDIAIDGSTITKMDTAGAWLLVSLKNKFEQQGMTVSFNQFSEQYQSLLTIIKKQIAAETPLPKKTTYKWLVRIGMQTMEHVDGLLNYLGFIGELSMEALRILKKPKRLRWSELASVIYRNGYQALPIVSLLSFMIGVVITYQMGLQLKNYGANIFIVDLLGISILREFGPLLTAIMVAGRTGSAFTAQLGTMKINQEIDALDTMGVTPAELLLLPRLAGLLIALPLLTVWADIFGVLGGMIMAGGTLDVSWYDFLRRFPMVVPLKALLLGLVKTPVFALIIASVGCFQGMGVSANSDSVGQNTTKSVVLSIFFIIVADAVFSIIFSELHL